ncbi:MAG: chemotaxis response regulator protein-glutamate methylesterase [Treponema sp.]|nr:chemotaxis response regulator protein-glutamate methylesterase [Treponema sp.]
MDKISVMICDDSALMRNLIGRIITEIDGFEIAGKAENGQVCLSMIEEKKPDVILLDVEMPVMNGIEFLKKRRELGLDIPVIMLSSVTTEGAAVTMQCLELGATDFISKPGGSSVTLKISDVSTSIVDFVASYGRVHACMHGKQVPDAEYFIQQAKLKEAERFVIQKKGEEAAKKATESVTKILPSDRFMAPRKKEPVIIKPEREGGKIEVIAIGISTGGPNALREMFKDLDKDIKQPILVVQHMPAGFTNEFAQSLDNICPLEVTEAKDGEPLMGGHIYIAPGGKHIMVEHRAISNVIRTTEEPPRNGHRPSADVLFESIAKVYENRSLGVIMTGMGRDGAVEITEMRKKGAWTLGQDEKSCIVYGMPKVAWEMGGVQKQIPLDNLAMQINRLALKNEF